jgi:hypothetical protein
MPYIKQITFCLERVNLLIDGDFGFLCTISVGKIKNTRSLVYLKNYRLLFTAATLLLACGQPDGRQQACPREEAIDSFYIM